MIELVIIFLMFVVSAINLPTVFLSILLILLSRISYSHRILSLLFLFFFTMVNKSIFNTPDDSILKYLTILYFLFDCIAIYLIKYKSVMLFNANRQSIFVINSLGALFIFCISTSYIPTISIFKLLIFVGGVVSIKFYLLIIAQSGQQKLVVEWFEQFGLFIILSSFATLFVPSIGYYVNGTGFQGILIHPQSFGIFCVLYFLFFFHKFTQSDSIKSVKYLIILIVLFYFAYLSESRTAILSIIFSTASYLIFLKRNNLAILNQKILLILMFTVFLTIIILYFRDAIFNNIEVFMSKRVEDGSIFSAYQNSRGELIQSSLDNFAVHPIFGIGFGIPSNYDTADISYDPIFNIPIGTPLEKGMILSATIEENGIIGTFFIIILLFSFITTSSKNKLVYLFFLGFFASNFGEYTMFSLGGMGLLGWLIVLMSPYMDSKTIIIQENRANKVYV